VFASGCGLLCALEGGIRYFGGGKKKNMKRKLTSRNLRSKKNSHFAENPDHYKEGRIRPGITRIMNKVMERRSLKRKRSNFRPFTNIRASSLGKGLRRDVNPTEKEGSCRTRGLLAWGGKLSLYSGKKTAITCQESSAQEKSLIIKKKQKEKKKGTSYLRGMRHKKRLREKRN